MKRRKAHNKLRVVSFKIPEENYNQIILHIPKGQKSNFIKNATMEKLQKLPTIDKVLELEQRINNLEKQVAMLKQQANEKEKAHFETFCKDEND